MKSKAVCILGMHRSGTSAIARSLNILGVYLGEEERLLQPSEKVNPEGFWEHIGLIDVQDRLLKTLSRTWYDFSPLPDKWWEYESIQGLKDELYKIVRNEFTTNILWGWKDPRTCFLLPVWQELFKKLDIEVVYIIIVRNPLDVSASLLKRDGLTAYESFLLWQLYTLSAVIGTKNTKRVIIQYENLLEDWKTVLKKISLHLELPWPANEKKLEEEMDTFIKPDLCHSHSTMESLIINHDTPEITRSTYELLLKADTNSDLLHSDYFQDKFEELYNKHLSQEIFNNKLLDIYKFKNDQIQRRNLDIYSLQDELRGIQEELRNRDERIQLIFNTLSWKITSPLRWIGRFLEKNMNI